MVQTAAQNRLHAGHQNLRLRLVDALLTGTERLHEVAMDRITGCCGFPVFCVSDDGHPRLSLARCRHRLCPFCMKIRARETSRRVAGLVVGFNAPRLITLTLREDGRTLRERLDRLSKSFRDLRRLRRWKERVQGGVYCTEVTTGEHGTGWHVHLHLIVDGEFYEQAALSADWEAATGDSPIVDIRAVHNREKAAYYVSKYVAKSTELADWSDQQITEYAAAMHRRRVVSTFGTAHGQSAESGSTETERQSSEQILHVEPIRSYARKGNGDAIQIMAFADRLGGRWRAAFGIPPPHPEAPTPLALSEVEERTMVECVRSLADFIAHGELEPQAPGQPRNHPPPTLFDDRYQA